MSDNDQDRGEGKSPETQKVTPPDELEGKVTPPDELEGNYFFKTEFDIRNREILDNSDKIYRIIQIVFTFVPTFLAGVLALGKRDGERSWWFVPITSERSWWFVPITSLLVFAIIIPSVLLVTSSLRSTVRASQYLRLRYFSSGRLKGWEHYIQFFRANAQTTKYRFFANSLTWIFAGLSLLTIVVSLTSVGVNISQAKKDLAWLLIYILILLICVILSIVSIQNLKKSWSSKAFAKCYNDWLLIDKDIKKGITLEQIPAGEDEAIAKLIDVERQLLQRKIDHDKLPAPNGPCLGDSIRSITVVSRRGSSLPTTCPRH